jgi:hypothetical protein
MAGGLLKSAAGVGPMGAMGRGAAAAGAASMLGLDGWRMAVVSASAAVGGLGTAAAAAALGLQGVANHIDKQQTKQIGESGMRGALFRSMELYRQDPSEANRNRLVASARDVPGFFKKGGGLNAEGYFTEGHQIPVEELNGMRAAFVAVQEALPAPGLKDFAAAADRAKMRLNMLSMKMLPSDAKKDPTKGKDDKKLEIKMPITVMSNDPDRFAVNLNKAVQRLAKNPRSARRALMGGF